VLELLLTIGGVIGVLLMLLAYAGIHFSWFDPTKAPALFMNLGGSSLVLLSMLHAFNLPAFLMEVTWAAVAAFGLVKLVVGRRRHLVLRQAQDEANYTAAPKSKSASS